ncbi:GspH/FimT family pseudopilin [Thermomonas flagellata]|uniref:GspH/FimT family pseudopilin n=1 Tax=Thermomonas flagellata TaxID=2888524 RepID=UPI001F044A66|nr:GspH/FimT family pseudopilin [Thermomonas flagellata]
MPDARNRIEARRRSRIAGFTLVELMVTVAVLGVLAVVAVPAMQGLVNGNRLRAATGELQAAIQIAKTEAVRRNVPVTLCGSSDGSTCASTGNWTRWVIRGRDPATPSDVDVIRSDAPTGGVQISGPPAGIVFRPSGRIDAQAQITACLPTTNPADNQRIVTIMVSGITSYASNNGGGNCP